MKLIFSARIILILAISLIACLFFDFLALHDIYNDYASKAVITRFSPGMADAFPTWTNTRGEWNLLDISYIVKIIVAVLLVIVSLPAIKNKRDEAKQ
jgi:hypothetical protein